jgi:ABC-2 type transport system permease protein
VVVFGAPVLLAYGVVHRAGPLYYGLALTLGPLYFLIPAAIGVCITTILVNVFPARRARDLLMILGVVFLGLAFMMFRAIRPERLVDPNAFANLAQFFGALSVPDSGWLPSTWATRALGLAMRGRSGWFEPAGTLALTSGAFVFLAAWFTSALYFNGWSKAQEGRRATLNRFQGEWLHRLAVRILGARGGAILAKDARSFFRDAGQWSQVLLLLALVAIYLMSIKALPFDVLTFDTTTYRNAVAYLNLGMGGFVLAGISARFLFPAVSAEGRSIWIVRAAPMGARDLVRAKFASGVLPILVVGQVISLSSSFLLRVSPFVMWSGAITTAVIAVAVSALAVGLGAQMPDFKAENLAKVASGFGGVVFMACALVYLGAIVLFEAYPTYLVARNGFELSGRQWLLSGACYAAVLVTSAVVGRLALDRGARSLEQREIV